LWPTWSNRTARQSLADLVEAQRAYVAAILAASTAGRRADEQHMWRLSRRARLARMNAEAAVARSLTEPETRRIDARQSQAALGGLRRLVSAAHVIRLDAQEDREHRARPGLEILARDLDHQLGLIQDGLATGAPIPGAVLPDLRAQHGSFADGVPDDEESAGLVAELDEIVDVANGLAEATGYEDLGDEARGAPSRRVSSP
jgi:hypothetical protein